MTITLHMFRLDHFCKCYSRTLRDIRLFSFSAYFSLTFSRHMQDQFWKIVRTYNVSIEFQIFLSTDLFHIWWYLRQISTLLPLYRLSTEIFRVMQASISLKGHTLSFRFSRKLNYITQFCIRNIKNVISKGLMDIILNPTYFLVLQPLFLTYTLMWADTSLFKQFLCLPACTLETTY